MQMAACHAHGVMAMTPPPASSMRNSGMHVPVGVLLLLQLYDVHRRGAMSKGVMEYLHISKSGGTSWCHMASEWAAAAAAAAAQRHIAKAGGGAGDEHVHVGLGVGGWGGGAISTAAAAPWRMHAEGPRQVGSHGGERP